MKQQDSSTSNNKTFVSNGPEDTWKIAKQLVEFIEQQISAGQDSSTIIALHGDLGSGKTCFVQGLAKALGIDQAVTSPTFTIVNEYRGRRPLYHIDLYRLKEPDETLSFGFEEYLEAKGITAIEWAERAGDLIPHSAIHIYFETASSPDERRITIE